MNKTIKINGEDCTSLFTPYGANVTYKKIRGNNAGYMLDGSYIDDVIAIKAEIKLTCIPLTEDQLFLLLEKINQEYVDLFYFDPKTNGYKTVKAMPSDISQTFRGIGSNEMAYWTGLEITFTEV